MSEPIYVTRPSMPEMQDYVKEIENLWNSRWLTNMGDYHNRLENALQQFLRVQGVSLMTNGHMALELALQALNLKWGGEIITTPFTFVSTTHAIIRCGLKPVFCDIDSVNLTIDPDKIEQLITENTVAILPVHVFGQMCDVERIEAIAHKHGLKVLYDAAHTFGEFYGERSVSDYGDLSILSFHATKVFNTVEGGAVIYHDNKLGKKLYDLRNFGIIDEEIIEDIGANAKMDEFRAIMGLKNLERLEKDISKRKAIALEYEKLLADLDGIALMNRTAGVKNNYGYMPILIENDFSLTRDQVYEELKKYGIMTRKYFYPLTCDVDCCRIYSGMNPVDTAREVSNKILMLPIYPDLKMDEVYFICEMIRKLAS